MTVGLLGAVRSRGISDTSARPERTLPVFSSTTSWSLPREKCITRPEIGRILAQAKETSPADYVFLATAINTGLRMCEVVHLKKCDLLDGQLRITRRKKKNLKPEVIDVVPALWAVLAEWGQMFESDEWIFPGRAGACFVHRKNGTVIQVCNGGHISRRNMQRRWDVILRGVDLKMPGRGIHSARHYAVTRFYEDTRDLRACQMFAGHSSSMITERYAHVLEMRDRVHSMGASL